MTTSDILATIFFAVHLYRRRHQMWDKDMSINLDREKESVVAERSAEPELIAADSVTADLEVAKLAADLDDLRQTLQ